MKLPGQQGEGVSQHGMILHAIAALDAASSGLSEAQNCLHAEWIPAGSALPPPVAEAVFNTLRTIGDQAIGIETAKRSLYAALEVLGVDPAGRNVAPGTETDGGARLGCMSDGGRPALRIVNGASEATEPLDARFTIADVAKSCGLPQPVIAQLVPRTWTDDGWMYTAAQIRAAEEVADDLRRGR